MKITNNQQDISFKENLIVRFTGEFERFGQAAYTISKSIAERTGKVSYSDVDLCILLDDRKSVLVTDIKTPLGQAFRRVYDYVDGIARKLPQKKKGKQVQELQEADRLLGDTLAIVVKDVRDKRLVVDAFGNPIDG